MTEQELREKIVEVMFIVGVKNDRYTDGKRFICDDEMAKNIADALISSGYVVDMPALIDGSMGIFVPEKGSMKLFPASIKEQLSAAEQRAEVAERALQNACSDNERIGFMKSKEKAQWYYKQAEKELEGKVEE